MSARRALHLALVLAPLACAVTYSPGDYLAPAGANTQLVGGADAGIAETGTSTPTPLSDASAPPLDAGFAATHIVLVGGHRDPLDGETGGANVAEIFQTTFSSAGVLGRWSFDAAPPVAAPWTHAELAGGSLFVHNGNTLVRASFTTGVAGPWSELPIKTPVGLPGALKPWLLDAHGFLAGPPFLKKSIYALPFLPDGRLGDWTEKSAALTAERVDVTLAHLGDLVYAIGGRRLGGAGSDATVEVAKLDANGDLGSFTALGKLGGDPTAPGGPAPETATYAPVVALGAGRIVVLGGQATNGGSPTDVAFAATITDLTTGALGPWRTLPKLPAPLTGCAVVVTTNHILVFGGQRATGTSDVILDLTLQADGSYGSAWIPIGTLPAARSGLVAVTY